MINFRIIFIAFFALSSAQLFAQYSKKADVMVFGGYSLVKEKRTIGDTGHNELSYRHTVGGGLSIFPNCITNPHFKIGITLYSETYSKELRTTINDLLSSENMVERTKLFRSITAEGRYYPRVGKFCTPFAILGLGTAYIKASSDSRKYIFVDNSTISDLQNVESETTISYTAPQYNVSMFAGLVVNAGLGLEFNVNETVYLNLCARYSICLQNSSQFIGSKIESLSGQFGVGFRLFKSKTIF